MYYPVFIATLGDLGTEEETRQIEVRAPNRFRAEDTARAKCERHEYVMGVSRKYALGALRQRREDQASKVH